MITTMNDPTFCYSPICQHGDYEGGAKYEGDSLDSTADSTEVTSSAAAADSAVVAQVLGAGAPTEDVMSSERVQLIQKVFYAIDDDTSGYIDGEELLTFARYYEHDESFSAERSAKLLRKIDTNNDGLISEEEFVAFFAAFSASIEDDQEFREGSGRR